MNEYSGVHGDFHWEWRGQTLHVFSAKPRIGLLRTFENVVAQNSEQAQWAAQARIDRNLAALLLHRSGAGRGPCQHRSGKAVE